MLILVFRHVLKYRPCQIRFVSEIDSKPMDVFNIFIVGVKIGVNHLPVIRFTKYPFAFASTHAECALYLVRLSVLLSELVESSAVNTHSSATGRFRQEISENGISTGLPSSDGAIFWLPRVQPRRPAVPPQRGSQLGGSLRSRHVRCGR